MKKLIVVFCLIALSLQARALPEWTVTGKYKKYPEIQYLTTLGIGSTKEAADDQARGGIAKIFKAKIQEESLTILNSTHQYAKNGVQTHSEETMKEVTKVVTDKTLTGIEIKETISENLDDVSKRYYSLAVLDKIKMQSDLSSEILDIDKSIDSLVISAEAEKDLLKKIRYFSAAIPKILKRNMLNGDLKIVDSSGTGIEPSKHTLSDLNSRLSNILTNDFKVGINLEGNNVVSVQEALSEGLTREGFIIEPDITKCSITITGNIELKKIDHPLNKEGWMIFQYSGSFQVVDPKTKNQYGSYPITGKATQLSESAAREKAIENLKKDISDKVAVNISKVIFGNHEKTIEPNA